MAHPRPPQPTGRRPLPQPTRRPPPLAPAKMEANGAPQRHGGADPAAAAPATGTANGGAHAPTLPPPPHAPRRPRAGWAPELTLGFTPMQLNVLRNQIMVYRSFKVRGRGKKGGGWLSVWGQVAPLIHGVCVCVWWTLRRGCAVWGCGGGSARQRRKNAPSVFDGPPPPPPPPPHRKTSPCRPTCWPRCRRPTWCPAQWPAPCCRRRRGRRRRRRRPTPTTPTTRPSNAATAPSTTAPPTPTTWPHRTGCPPPLPPPRAPCRAAGWGARAAGRPLWRRACWRPPCSPPWSGRKGRRGRRRRPSWRRR